MQNDSVVILSALRTPIGSFQGKLSPLTAPQLAAAANRAVLDQAGIDPVQIGEVVYGCVLPAGVGQAPARQGALAAGIPESELFILDTANHVPVHGHRTWDVFFSKFCRFLKA